MAVTAGCRSSPDVTIAEPPRMEAVRKILNLLMYVYLSETYKPT